MLFRKIVIIIYIIILSFIRIITHLDPVLAAGFASGVAIDVEIEGKGITEGSIISLNEGKYRLSTVPYDSSVYGVVTEHPAVAFVDTARTNKYSVVSSGKTLVRVSSVNGIIKKGDVLTTSSKPGIAQKATENGYVIGIANEDYTNSNPDKIGTIRTTLHLNFGMLSSSLRDNLIASLIQGARAPFSSPLNTLRYITAAIISMGSFIGGFLFFGKVSSRGVEAVGRNPLARRFILVGVFMNVMLTLGLMLFGVVISYLILVI